MLEYGYHEPADAVTVQFSAFTITSTKVCYVSKIKLR